MEMTVAGGFSIGRSRPRAGLIGICLVLLVVFACLFAFNWSTTDCVMSFTLNCRCYVIFSNELKLCFAFPPAGGR